MKQSAKLELFNYLFEKLQSLGVPVITTKELELDLNYPFIAIQNVSDSVDRLTFDSFGGHPTVTVHVWGLDEDKGKHDALYMNVQDILMDDIQLPNYFLYYPQFNVNELTEIDSNQALLHTIINVEYESH
ncbi:hypothetical protein QI340_00340 [Staphylococcus saprophyticus]|uniref:hypothetical protein n=1 Tax=Staphylococcus saprophyticus TaxID=29385 RepID=UPI0010113379|nr:hypothetical protein [Staphylococcus saprophyticus]MDW3910644.1 hypothetical protein [Staphylococcus saprophyticus]MDW3933610.1 hypothetical protein [Staphylococcus saprophyticus]RXS23229.1 hypothetical protein EUA47_03090 [Staphylococcus saprophyticus]